MNDPTDEARQRGALDGIICGHIHHAEIRLIGNILYCNDGDWVESCTALVEDRSGQLSIVHWTDNQNHLFPLKKRSKNMKIDAWLPQVNGVY